MRPFRYSLKQIFFVIILLLVAVPLVMVWLVGGLATDKMSDDISQQNLSLAKSLAGEVGEILQRASDLLLEIKSSVSQGLVAPHSLNEYLAAKIMYHPEFFSMILMLDHRGHVEYVAPFRPSFVGLDWSRHVAGHHQGGNGSISWSSTFLSPRTGHPTMTLSVSYIGGTVVGYLDLSRLRRIVARVDLGRHGYAAIVDQKGTAIAHRDNSRVERQANLKDIPLVRQGLAGKQGVLEFGGQGQEMLGSVAIVKQTGWPVLVVQSVREAFSTVHWMVNLIWAGALIIGCIAALATLWLVKTVQRPLAAMASNAERVAGGDYVFEPPRGGFAELGVLAAAFEVMIGAIEARERAMKANEQRLRVLVESSAEGILALDENRYISNCNSAFLKLLGYTWSEVLNHSTRLIHADQEAFEQFGRIIYRTIAERGFWQGEWSFRHKGGGLVPTEVSLAPLRDPDGRLTGYVSILRDIRERKATEAAVRLNAQRLAEINECLLGMGEDYNVNVERLTELCGTLFDATCAMYSRRQGEMLCSVGCWHAPDDFKTESRSEGHICHDVIEQGDNAPLVIRDLPHTIYARTDSNVMRHGMQTYIGHAVKRGHEVVGSICAVFNTDVEPSKEDLHFLGMIASALSAEENRRLAVEALKRSEAGYRNLFNSISDLIYTQDMEGRFLSVNRALAQTFEYRPDELVGVEASSFMKPEFREAFRTQYLERLKQEGKFQGVSAYFSKSGETRYIEYRSSLVTPADGEPYISGSGRDVTERVMAERDMKALQRQLQQAQKMEAIGTLAGGIAHDFNNILAAIVGYSELGLRDGKNNKPTPQKHQQVLQAAERARELVQQILTFSRKADFEPKLLDINQTIADTVPIIERTIPKMVSVEIVPASDLGLIRGDANQMEQVLLNLAGNAKDAMPDGGTLLITTEKVTLDQAGAKALFGAPGGDYVLLTVSDTGEGMDSETVEHIFEPFFTTKETGKGTGLGLASVYGIVKGHKGYITCHSEPGVGTVFKIYLPCAESCEQPAPAETPEADVIATGSETILVVDDEEALRDVYRDVLGGSGYRTITAATGEEALDIYRARGDEVDLVLLDISMPGMGGQKCLQELVKLNPEVKVVIASGYSHNTQLTGLLAAGASRFLPKPFVMSDLLKTLRQVLDQ